MSQRSGQRSQQRTGFHRIWGPREPGPPRRREWQVVLLLRQGLRDEEIAGRLQISASTVRGHIYRLRERLGAATRIDLLQRVPWEQCPPELQVAEAGDWSHLKPGH